MDRVRVKQIPVESFLFLVVTTTQQQVAQHRAYGVTSTIFLEGACGVLDGANVTVHARHDVGGRHEHCVGLRLVLVLVLVLGLRLGCVRVCVFVCVCVCVCRGWKPGASSPVNCPCNRPR